MQAFGSNHLLPVLGIKRGASGIDDLQGSMIGKLREEGRQRGCE